VPVIHSAVPITAFDFAWALHDAAQVVVKPVVVSDSGLPAPTPGSLIAATASRTEQTYEAVLMLAETHAQQATMLLRSMFEDVVVVHWLLLHEDEVDHYARRLSRHANAMTLAQDRSLAAQEGPRANLNHLRASEAELIAEFGQYAQKAWWERDASGQENRLPAMVDEIVTAKRFWGRTHGETEIFRHTYQLTNKWANSYLHHTLHGILLRRFDEDRYIAAAPSSVMVVSQAYYLYAMAICAVIDANGTTPQTTPFWGQFMSADPQMIFAVGNAYDA
jgi:hypothetical protein